MSNINVSDLVKFIDKTLLATATRMYRRMAVCPLMLVRIYEDVESPAGFRYSAVDHENDGSQPYGYYTTQKANRFLEDYSKSDGNVGIVYMVPKDSVDHMPGRHENVRHLVVGYHLKVGDKVMSGEKVITYFLTEVQTPESARRHAARLAELREHYYTVFCENQGVEPCEYMEEEFERRNWSKLRPNFLEITSVIPWEAPSLESSLA